MGLSFNFHFLPFYFLISVQPGEPPHHAVVKTSIFLLCYDLVGHNFRLITLCSLCVDWDGSVVSTGGWSGLDHSTWLLSYTGGLGRVGCLAGLNAPTHRVLHVVCPIEQFSLVTWLLNATRGWGRSFQFSQKLVLKLVAMFSKQNNRNFAGTIITISICVLSCLSCVQFFLTL